MSSTSSSMTSSANSTTSSMMSSSANSTSSTASSTTSSLTTASASPTTVNGVTFDVQNNTIYSGTMMNPTRKRAADSGIDMCLNKCASNSTCQGTAYDNSTMTCTYYSSVDRSSQMTKNGTTFALVENRPSNSTNSTTSSAPSSTMTMSLNSTSSLTRSTTRRMNTTSSHSMTTTSSRSMTITANTTGILSHSSTMSSNTTSSTSATPTNLVGARSCKQIAAAGSTFTDSNNVTYAVICSKMQKRMLFDESALSIRAAGDLATVQSGSFEGCAPYCDANSQCNSYSYDPTNGTCYLESTSSVTQPVAGRDYAYKVQSTTSSSSTSSTSSSTSTSSNTTSSSSTSSSSTSDFVPDGSFDNYCVRDFDPINHIVHFNFVFVFKHFFVDFQLKHVNNIFDVFIAVLDVIKHLGYSSSQDRNCTVATVVSQQTRGAVVTSYSVVSSGSTVTVVDTATSVLSIYTSTMQVASVRRSTVTTVQSAQPSVVTVGAVTVTTDVVVPSGYTTVTGTVTQNRDITVATGVATVTQPASTVTTTVATLTTSAAGTVTSGISTVTMNAAPMSFLTVVRREEMPLQEDKTESKEDEKKGEEKKDRPWFAFDGMTEMWM
ncbi:hypothetical protein KCU85_g1137, partial [Aureobasidium melanogenum]